MPASAETRAAADLVRAEQLVALAGAQPVGAQPVAPPIDYNVPYSPPPPPPPPVELVAPDAPPPVPPTLPQPGEPGAENYYGNDPSLGPVDPGAPNYSVLTEGPQDVASSGNTYPVGLGPYPTLEPGVYQGNYFGNDPTLGLTSQDVPRYSLLESERDVASSGNTYAVGTGPRPGLGAGVHSFGSYQEGTEGRTLGGAREATGLANLEYQLAGGVPGSSRLTRFSGEKDTMSPEAITAGLAAAGPVAIAGIARAALAAGASIPAIAARLGMSAAELKLTLAEFAGGAGIIGASESYRPEGMRPSVIDRATTRVRGWFDGDEDRSSAAVEDLSQPRGEQPDTLEALEAERLANIEDWMAWNKFKEEQDRLEGLPHPGFRWPPQLFPPPTPEAQAMRNFREYRGQTSAEEELLRLKHAERAAGLNRPRITPADLRRLNPEEHAGFDEALPSEVAISRLRENSPFGGLSPRAAALDAASEVITALSPGEKARGRRYAETAAGFPTVRRERGGLAGLADRGRYGDSMLVHMAPEEVAGLASLTPNGVTTNPETGLPEMFNLRAMLPTIITIGAGIMSGGTLSPLAAAALSGVTTAAVSEGTTSERLGKGLAAGIGTYGMGQLTGSLGSAGAAADAQGTAAISDAALQDMASRPGVSFTDLNAETQTALRAQGITPDKWSALRPGWDANLQDMTPANPAVPQVFTGPGVGTPTAGPYGPLMAPSAGGGWAGEPAHWYDAHQRGRGLPFYPDNITSGAAPMPQGFDPSLQTTTGSATPSPLFGPNKLALQAQSAKFRPLQSSYSPEQLRQAAAGVFDPTVRAAQARSAYEAAGPMERLEFAGKGLGQVDLSSWGEAAPGKIAVGDLATPALQTAIGIGGTLPVEEYEPPARRTYDDQGPYLPAERRRRTLPPGYTPGVSPQLTYFAAGTHGKTVSGGLPTLYAQSGTSPAEQGEDPSGGIGNVQGGPSPTGGGIAFSPPAVAPKTGYGSGKISLVDFPPPEAHHHEMSVIAARAADEDQGFIESLFDYTVPQGHVNPETGQPTIEDSINMAAVAGTVIGAITGIPGLGTGMGAIGRSSMGLHADQNTATPDANPGEQGGPGEDDLRLLAAPALPGTSEEERLAEEERQRMLALSGNQRFTGLPPATYQPGIDPQFSYFAQEGTGGMTIEENIDVETAAEMPAGVAATTGIMQGAPVEVQDDVEVRLSERQVEEPQNPRERAIYDRAVLALQNELEPEVAQRAIDEFLEVFGPEALHMLQEMVRGERENGGTVETANGETTIAEGELQGPDVIAGKIVDPVTGEETANLRVGENEYIEPAASLARRAQVAGLPPTPENGAMLRGEEERMLRQAVG